MPTPQEARAELAKRELARRGIYQETQKPSLLARGLGSYASMMGPEGGYGAAPWGKLASIMKKPFDIGGEKIAEVGGRVGFPKTGAAIGTAVQMAPDVGLSLVGGPEQKVASEPGFISKSLEDWAGVKPGALSKTFEDPSLLFAKGRKGAQPYYQMLEKEISGSKLLSESKTNEELVEKAFNMAKKGTLKEGEALEARKAADALRKSRSINQNWLMNRRQAFDKIAKESSDISQGDIAYKRGTMAESMRSLFPRNVGGRASPFKVGEAMALAHFGPVGKVLSSLFSPLALGSGAAGLGMGAKVVQNPGAASALLELLRRNRENPNPQ